MEWNFEFRIDHLNETGEERNLKGLVYTKEGEMPKLEQIKQFLHECGYKADIKDPENLVFSVPNPHDPIEIKIIKMSNNKAPVDRELRMLAEQFMKRDPIGL